MKVIKVKFLRDYNMGKYDPDSPIAKIYEKLGMKLDNDLLYFPEGAETDTLKIATYYQGGLDYWNQIAEEWKQLGFVIIKSVWDSEV